MGNIKLFKGVGGQALFFAFPIKAAKVHAEGSSLRVGKPCLLQLPNKEPTPTGDAAIIKGKESNADLTPL